MREQVIVQKVGNRSGIGQTRRSSGGQKPVRRERGHSGRGTGERLRGLVGYIPTILKLALAIGIGVLLFTGYRAAASASFFQIRKVEVQGTTRASNEDVNSLIRRELARTGVWQADLTDLSARLEQLPWVRRAIISRVLPDGVRVRISERMPRAVVRTGSGRFRWIDEDAVFLGEMSTTDQMPAFFLRGLSEDDSEAARVENIERVRLFLNLQKECDANGISERVSEINLSDLRDVRAQLAGDDSQIELRLGSKDLGVRLKKGLEVLDQQRTTSLGPYITYIIMDQKTPIVGHSGAAKRMANNDTADTTFEVDKKKRSRDTTQRR